jgi:hypothetical protein
MTKRRTKMIEKFEIFDDSSSSFLTKPIVVCSILSFCLTGIIIIIMCDKEATKKWWESLEDNAKAEEALSALAKYSTSEFMEVIGMIFTQHAATLIHSFVIINQSETLLVLRVSGLPFSGFRHKEVRELVMHVFSCEDRGQACIAKLLEWAKTLRGQEQGQGQEQKQGQGGDAEFEQYLDSHFSHRADTENFLVKKPKNRSLLKNKLLLLRALVLKILDTVHMCMYTHTYIYIYYYSMILS